VNHVVLSVSVSPNLVITYRVEHLGGCLGQGDPESLSSSGHPSFSDRKDYRLDCSDNPSRVQEAATSGGRGCAIFLWHI
jgi:hypothetical protein